MDYIASIQHELRRRLEQKLHELATNKKWDDGPAVRRNEKSIALLTSKLLCTHAITSKRYTIHGRATIIVHCHLCRSSAHAHEGK